MRITIALTIVLVACGSAGGDGGGSGSGKRERHSLAPLPEDCCDPATPRVCVGNDVVACEPTGLLGRGLRACRDGCKDGACNATCDASGVELIYVVDDNNNLMSFDPRKLPSDPFRLIGRMQCGGSASSPYSMSVDRNGIAWVVYHSGQIYKVSIETAKCELSAYRGPAYRTFGMGFVTDEPGGKTEKLYVADDDGSHALSSIDTTQSVPTAREIAVMTGTNQHPELTGTSEAKLFGFYPLGDDEVSFVQEIDRKTAAVRGTRWSLGTSPIGSVSAYAFAHWAGVFYIFATANGDTKVHSIDRRTGAYAVVLEHLPYRITGAGVSTCAPELDSATGSGSRIPP